LKTSIIKNRIIILFLIVAFSSCKDSNTNANTVEDETLVFQSVLDSIYSENKNAIGLMVHIESPKKEISWSGVAGFSDKNNSKLHVNQPALIASNTKTYVSVAILRLVELGKLDLNQTIENLISKETNDLLMSDGYHTSQIKVVQLLNHTSGIHDYATTDEYMQMVKDNPKHRYTRDEQIQLAMKLGEPLGQPGEMFSYADVNYLLLTEIIESYTGQPFYTSIRELINYDKLGMQTTWFSTLEEYPKNALPLAHQYWKSEGMDSYNVDHSFDLYGGGGLASSTKDLAVFCQSLFNNKIFDNDKTLDLIYTKANPIEPMDGAYCLGISPKTINGIQGFGHGGFWGTTVNYFPKLDTSIAIFVLNRDKRILRLDLNQALIKALLEL
jgi:D-alanyl-D-alanine carboxypeptidase